MIDWTECVCKLRAHMTYCQIAKATGMNWQHVRRLASGETEEPRFNAGVRLLDLAYDVLSPDDFKRIRQC